LSIFSKLRAALEAVNRSPLWFRLSCLFLLILAVCLLALSFSSAIYASRFASSLVPALLVGLGLAVLVFALYFRVVWRKQRAIDTTSRAADQKLASVFEHVLDGIIIVDDAGICLDSNPGAGSILGVSHQALAGQSISHFCANPEEFDHSWKSFRDSGNQRGRAQLRRGDGKIVFVEYALAANYMPGRHLMVLCDTTEKRAAEASLRESQERLQELAENIQEVFWVMDAKTKQILFVTPTYETLTGYSSAALYEDRLSCERLIHTEDRNRVLQKLDEAAATGQFDQEFRIVRADGAVRWISCKTTPRPPGQPQWFVGTAMDITERHQAELDARRNLAAAEAAHAETEALRKSTFALTQNLPMDTVLDTLLACLRDLVPYDSATVILAEDELRLFVAREAPKHAGKSPFIALETTDSRLLQRVLIERKSVSVSDAAEESGWREIKPFAGNRSWMGIPLMTATSTLGLLSIGAATPRRFTAEHLRLAKSMAAPAAAAICNVRLQERAVIFASELERYINELKETQKQLEHTRGTEASQS
jgi:PAS domain S-box-containing protein